jgi:alkyl sulfatase BDS1-like metallo-beta-lactamase superfamily hydrolase
MVDRKTGRIRIVDSSNFGKIERVGEGMAVVHSFANVGLIEGRRGLVLVDCSSALTAPQALLAIRGAFSAPIEHIVYTHGHADHCGGTERFLQDAAARGHARPVLWAHENVLARFARYERTWAWNDRVNRHQFGSRQEEVFPRTFVRPDRTYRDTATIELEGEPLELVHALGETDDATWIWLPQRKAAFIGDLLIDSLPNAGNPNKVQRHTVQWAEALEAIASKEPQHVIRGHHAPISGGLALEMLRETARALRFVHDAVVDRLNAGQWPGQIVDEGVRLPDDLAAKPYLEPVYGCTEFLVRDVLRQYAGWWDGRPADLLPDSRAVVARDVLAVAGRDRLVQRARQLNDEGEPRRALHLAQLLIEADPADGEGRAVFVAALEELADREPSFIARNLYAQLARQGRQPG